MPLTPPMKPEVRAALKQRGVGSVRALLVSMSNGFSGTGRGAAIDLGDGVFASRADMEEFVAETDRAADRWLKAGAIAAIAAAVFAFLAWMFPLN